MHLSLSLSLSPRKCPPKPGSGPFPRRAVLQLYVGIRRGGWSTMSRHRSTRLHVPRSPCSIVRNSSGRCMRKWPTITLQLHCIDPANPSYITTAAEAAGKQLQCPDRRPPDHPSIATANERTNHHTHTHISARAREVGGLSSQSVCGLIRRSTVRQTQEPSDPDVGDL